MKRVDQTIQRWIKISGILVFIGWWLTHRGGHPRRTGIMPMLGETRASSRTAFWNPVHTFEQGEFSLLHLCILALSRWRLSILYSEKILIQIECPFLFLLLHHASHKLNDHSDSGETCAHECHENAVSPAEVWWEPQLFSTQLCGDQSYLHGLGVQQCCYMHVRLGNVSSLESWKLTVTHTAAGQCPALLHSDKDSQSK